MYVELSLKFSLAAGSVQTTVFRATCELYVQPELPYSVHGIFVWTQGRQTIDVITHCERFTGNVNLVAGVNITHTEPGKNSDAVTSHAEITGGFRWTIEWQLAAAKKSFLS